MSDPLVRYRVNSSTRSSPRGGQCYQTRTRSTHRIFLLSVQGKRLHAQLPARWAVLPDEDRMEQAHAVITDSQRLGCVDCFGVTRHFFFLLVVLMVRMTTIEIGCGRPTRMVGEGSHEHDTPDDPSLRGLRGEACCSTRLPLFGGPRDGVPTGDEVRIDVEPLDGSQECVSGGGTHSTAAIAQQRRRASSCSRPLAQDIGKEECSDGSSSRSHSHGSHRRRRPRPALHMRRAHV